LDGIGSVIHRTETIKCFDEQTGDGLVLSDSRKRGWITWSR
jgi:hypothetical protein